MIVIFCTHVKWWHLCPFLNFSEFWFSGLFEGVKGHKMTQNDKKFYPSHSGTEHRTSCDCDFWYTCAKWLYLHYFFFIFSKFWFFGFSGRVKGKKITQNYQFQSFTLYISGTVDHIVKILSAQGQNNDISGCFPLFFKKIQHCKY